MTNSWIQLNYIDFVIVGVLLFHMGEGIQVGFFVLFKRLTAFFLSLVIAFGLYRYIGEIITPYFENYSLFTYAVAFAFIFFIGNLLISLLLNRLLSIVPQSIRYAWWSRVVGIVPAFIDGIILVSTLLILVVMLPTSPLIKEAVTKSKLGSILVDNVFTYQKQVDNFFGGLPQESLAYLTIGTEGKERISLPYKPYSLRVDKEAESKMLTLLNEERKKVGAPRLVLDPKMVMVARNHSVDMWNGQYFSHTNRDGLSPGSRLKLGGVSFLSAGENLALAPTLTMAHTGLMNSSGHKKNILDPDFHRVGIGVVDGGIYGKMFTQNFAD